MKDRSVRPTVGWPVAALAVNLLGVVLLACSSSAASPGGGSAGPGSPGGSVPEIAGVEWRAVSVVGRPPVPDHVPTIKFEPGRASGNAGCNSYGADVSISGTTLAVQQLMQTEMACIDANAMDIEGRFVDALGAATSIEVRDGRLVIGGPQGELVFEPAS